MKKISEWSSPVDYEWFLEGNGQWIHIVIDDKFHFNGKEIPWMEAIYYLSKIKDNLSYFTDEPPWWNDIC